MRSLRGLHTNKPDAINDIAKRITRHITSLCQRIAHWQNWNCARRSFKCHNQPINDCEWKQWTRCIVNEYRRRAAYNEEIGRLDRARYWWDRYEDCRS